MGKAAYLILSAVADGETDPGGLASYALGRVRASQEVQTTQKGGLAALIAEKR